MVVASSCWALYNRNRGARGQEVSPPERMRGKKSVLVAYGLPLVWEPLCWLAGRRPRRGRGPIRRLLVIALDNPGDVLLMTPCLTALRERFPSAAITMLVGEWARDLAAAHPAVSAVIVYNAPWFSAEVAHRPPRPDPPRRALLRCLWRLWRGRLD